MLSHQAQFSGLNIQKQPQSHFRDIYCQPLKTITAAIFMLGPWRPHMRKISKTAGKNLHHESGPVKELVMSCYSCTGRPALNQPEIFRAVVLASHFKKSISSFAARLKADAILAIACGFEIDSLPGVGSFYDLINRLWLEYAPAKVVRNPYKKKKKKLKANGKLPPGDPNTAADLIEKVLMHGCFPRDYMLCDF